MDDTMELLLNGQQYKKVQETYYSVILEKYALSLIDVRVLLFLSEHGSHNTAKDIVRGHCIAKSYVSKSIDKLIEKGFLERKHLQDDRRYVHLLIKEEALPVIEATQQQRKKMVQKLFDGISEEQLETLSELAQKISHNIAELEGTDV
jgi:MarR family transcriptional regulator for hemolysin